MKHDADKRAATHRVLVEIRADRRTCRERCRLCRARVEIEADEVAAAVFEHLLRDALKLLCTDIDFIRACLVVVPEPTERIVDLGNARCLVCRQPYPRRQGFEIPAVLDGLRQVAVNHQLICRPVRSGQVFRCLRPLCISRDGDAVRRRNRTELFGILRAPEPRIGKRALCRCNRRRNTVRCTRAGRHLYRIRLLRRAAAVYIL